MSGQLLCLYCLYIKKNVTRPKFFLSFDRKEFVKKKNLKLWNLVLFNNKSLREWVNIIMNCYCACANVGNKESPSQHLNWMCLKSHSPPDLFLSRQIMAWKIVLVSLILHEYIPYLVSLYLLIVFIQTWNIFCFISFSFIIKYFIFSQFLLL